IGYRFSLLFFFSLRSRRRPRSTLFPYTTLFRSEEILDRLGRELGLELERDHAEVDVQLYHGSVTWRVSAIPTRSGPVAAERFGRSEDHTSELQSRRELVCRLLLEKKKRRRRSAA